MAGETSVATPTDGTANTNPGGDGAAKTDAVAPVSTPVKTDAQPVGAPEKYADFKMAEGFSLEAETLKGFTGAAKEMGLSQANAQRLLDMASAHVQGQADKVNKQWADTREGWVSGLKADAEFGGAKFPETVERAQRVLTKFGSPEFRGFLAQTGLGDSADLVKMLARIDRAIGEDRIVDGASAPTTVDAAKTLYPNQGKG